MSVGKAAELVDDIKTVRIALIDVINSEQKVREFPKEYTYVYFRELSK